MSGRKKKKKKYLAIGLVLFATLGGLVREWNIWKRKPKLCRNRQRKGYLASLPENQPSLATRLNPFSAMTNTNPDTTIIKEYIYTGSRMLAVEDANANAATACWFSDMATIKWTLVCAWWTRFTTDHFQWGQNLDIPAEGDYDGDGKTDFAIFRPSSSTFWIFKSSDLSYYSIPFGTRETKSPKLIMMAMGKLILQ